MPNTVGLKEIDASELTSLRMLVGLLRHPDPMIPELARQALHYLAETAATPAAAAFVETPANGIGSRTCGVLVGMNGARLTHS